jgi:hypothetical protein
MRAFLLYNDRDFDPAQVLARRDKYREESHNDFREIPPWNGRDLTQDLGLNVLCKAMAGGDEFMLDVAKAGLLSGTADASSIRYRQKIFADCLKNEQTIRILYEIATDAVKEERSNSKWIFAKDSLSVLQRSVEVLQMFLGKLHALRMLVDERPNEFDSEGVLRLFAMLRRELSPEYLAEIDEHLQRLKFRSGVPIGAALGLGNKGINHILCMSLDATSWIGRLVGGKPKGYTWQVSPHDEIGSKTLSDLSDLGLHLVADAAGQSADHILTFFNMLRTELAFYIGCLNLRTKLVELGEPVCTPTPAPLGKRELSFRGLYDASLALSARRKVVGNDLEANGKDLFLITGANTGGKSTFLRSVGLAQLMMQAGMFVAAESFTAEVCGSVFTHYKREEDTWMQSGKWDEELSRMSKIVDNIKPTSLMLFNESFSSTNEREGAEIATQIVHALLRRRIKIFFVTHLYSFAHEVFTSKSDDAIFLRAERLPDGTRSFKLIEAEPLETSYGEDLYAAVFSAD